MCTALCQTTVGSLTSKTGNMLAVSRKTDVKSEASCEVYSPTVDLGKDFEALIRKCIAEKKAKELSENPKPIKPESGPRPPDDKEKENTKSTADIEMDLNGSPGDVVAQHLVEPVKSQENMEQENQTEKQVEVAVEADGSALPTNVSSEKETKGEASEIKEPEIIQKCKENESTKTLAEKIASTSTETTYGTEPWPTPAEYYKSSNKIDNKTQKDKLKKDKTKEAKKKRKWKHMSKDMLGFNVCLRQPLPVFDRELLTDMNKELQMFDEAVKDTSKNSNENPSENATADDSDNHLIPSGSACELDKVSDDVMENAKCASPNIKEEIGDSSISDDCCQNAHLGNSNEETLSSLYFNDYWEEWDTIWTERECDLYADRLHFYEDVLPCHTLDYLDLFEGIRAEKRKRYYKCKWRVQKARKQVKSKHCKSVSKRPHGRKLFIHHRLSKLITLEVNRASYLPNIRYTYKYIDKKPEREGWLEDGGKDYRPTYQANNSRVYRPPAAANRPRRDYPVAPRPPQHAINAYNADADLDAALVNLLINMQHRDLTPEDYEMLLQLDERVKPKTVEKNVLDSMKTDTVGQEHVDSMCAICMENYCIGQSRKHLPCEHVFHTNCIDMWLKNSSMNCPLDGLPIQN